MTERLVELAPSMETAERWSRLTEDWTEEQMGYLVAYLTLERHLEAVTQAVVRAVRNGRRYIGFRRKPDGTTEYVACRTNNGGKSSYEFGNDALQWAENALFRAVEEGFLDVTLDDLDRFLAMYSMGSPHPLAIAGGTEEEGP